MPYGVGHIAMRFCAASPSDSSRPLEAAAPTSCTQLLLAPRRTRVALTPDATGALLRRNAELLLHWLCGKVRARPCVPAKMLACWL